MSARLRLPNRFGPPLFGALLSGSMSFLVSGVATFRALGLPPVVHQWLRAWLVSWPIAFAAVLVMAPLVRRIVANIVEPPQAAVGSPSPRTGA